MRSCWILVALVGCGGSDGPDVAAAAPASTAKVGCAECPRVPPECPKVDAPSLSARLNTRLTDIVEKECDPGRPSVRDPALDAVVTGKWEGRFEYDEPQAGGTLEIDFTVADGELAGNATEVEGAQTMKAHLAGDVYETRQVIWMGTYFLGGDHSVLWTGTLDETGKRIDGKWRLHRGTGTFTLTRK